MRHFCHVLCPSVACMSSLLVVLVAGLGLPAAVAAVVAYYWQLRGGSGVRRGRSRVGYNPLEDKALADEEFRRTYRICREDVPRVAAALNLPRKVRHCDDVVLCGLCPIGPLVVLGTVW